MKACPSCFTSGSTWISNVSLQDASPAVCDFCEKFAPHTWLTAAWTETLTRLFSIYEVAESPDKGNELHIQIQSDWHIFTFADTLQVKRFLNSAFADSHSHPLLVEGVRVRLRFGSIGPNADHIVSWSKFSEEIRLRNRYFPQTELDGGLLRDALLGSVESITEETPLYRARVLGSDVVLKASEMGAPPANEALPGRANPVGIPYLYLSYEERTCIYETRVANHTRVAIGSFATNRELKVLNLADIEVPDFFSTEDPVSSISFYRYLQALGDELKRPVRSSDQVIDYIPTQYLCELAKSSGLDGVLYSSSLDHPDGRNVVLFDVEAADCHLVRVAEVTALTAEWQILSDDGDAEPS